MNYLAILVGGVINMVVGYLWYSPILFAKPWMKAMGLEKKSREEMQKGMGPKYGLMFLSALVFTYILSWFVNALGAHTFSEGLKVGFLTWLGFTMTSQLGSWLFSDKPKVLFFIDTSYRLITNCIVGGMLAVWR